MTSARSLYSRLESIRDPWLQRARDAASLTIPRIMPPSGHTGSSPLPTPWQSLGSKGVNNLAAKLLLALLPPGSSFFKLEPDLRLSAELEAQPDLRTELEQGLAKFERAVNAKLEQVGARAPLFLTLLHLIVTGNALLQVTSDLTLKVHPLDSYVVERDDEGKLLRIIVKETFSLSSLSEGLREWIEAAKLVFSQKGETLNERCQVEVDIYTSLYLEGSRWEAWQEAYDQEVPETRGSYALDRLPYLPLRFNLVDRESYGRGHVEANLGDLYAFETVSRAIDEASQIMSRVLVFVDEAGVTRKKDVSDAPNGGVVDGRASDVTVMQVPKAADLTVTFQRYGALERSIGESFLLGTSVRRDAERVTAEEVRLVANELETQLGGVYSLLATELQLPLVKLVVAQMQRNGELPKLPKEALNYKVVTGVEALGRSSDLQRLDLFVAGLAQTFGPESLTKYLNPAGYAKLRAAALSFDTAGLVRTEDEIAEMEAAQRQAELAQVMAPEAARLRAAQAAQPTTPTA